MEEVIVYDAHMHVSSDDPAETLQILDAYPNLIIDTTAYEPVLGQDPERARLFFIQYQDRVLFGTDGALQRTGKGTDRRTRRV
jgi:predicted TIM-barrel fold metal-dependent hydrolase